MQLFIEKGLNEDVNRLALLKNPFPEIPYSLILQQIEAKQRCQTKLPLWYHTAGLLYPPKLSIEQTSSEVCAQYKASIITGNSLIDLSGGFGVDAYYFSKKFKQVTHCEMQPELSVMVEHNCQILKTYNIDCVTQDSTDYLHSSNNRWDWIYVDPARRNESQKKVFRLGDCTPNVPELLDVYLNHTDHLLIKTAPLLDISSGLTELRYVKEIHIVAWHNEVKELLWVLDKNTNTTPKIISVNHTKERIDQLELDPSKSCAITYNQPLDYLYEPNAALMKSGLFDCIGQHFQVQKLHKHSHLYTAAQLLPFQGRRFKIEKQIAFNNKNAKIHLADYAGHIATRNFPLKADAFRKKWKIKENQHHFLFLTTDSENNKIMLFCSKIE